MNILNVKVRNRNLRINEKDLVGNNVGFDQVEFDFSEEWEKLEKVAVFYLNEDELYPVLVTDNLADIPYQVLKNNQVLYFGVYGVSNNQKILSSKILKIEIAAGCPIKTAEDYEEYEDIHVQILAKLADIYDRIIYTTLTEEEIETNWEKGAYQAGSFIETVPAYTARDIPVKGKLVFTGCPEGWYHTDYQVAVIVDKSSIGSINITLENDDLDKEIEIPDKYNTISITVSSDDFELVNQFKFKWNIYTEETIKERIDKKANKEYVDEHNKIILESIKVLEDNNNNIIDDLNRVSELADNASIAKSYSSYSEMVNVLNTLPMKSFKSGQVIHIATRDVPDVWIGNISETAIVYDFVSDEQFIEDMSPSYGVKVGYFYLIPCEADLSKHYSKEYIDNNVVPITRKIVGIPLDRDIDTYDIVKNLEGYSPFIYAVENAMMDSNVVSTYFGTSTVIKAINSYYYLKSEIDEKINDIKLAHIVDELPEIGLEGILYFVPKTEPETNDVYDEYRYINNAWELIGTKQITIDLTPYVKKTRTIANISLNEDITKSELARAIIGTFINDSVCTPELGNFVTSTINGNTKVNGKQDKLTAGDNITIDENNVIYSSIPSEYIKNTDYATNDGKAGVVKVNNGMYGVKNVDANIIGINRATDAEIEQGSNGFKPIVPSNLKKAVETIGGVLDELTTTDKSSYVSAINEILKFATRERSWKKVRTIVIPSDEYKGQTIDGVLYKNNITADGGIYRIIFETDEEGNALENYNITGAIVKVTPTTAININQGFITINNDILGGQECSLEYFTGYKNTTAIKWFEVSLEPYRAPLADNPARYIMNGQINHKQINKFNFGGYEAESVLGEGTQIEIWMYGYWDE